MRLAILLMLLSFSHSGFTQTGRNNNVYQQKIEAYHRQIQKATTDSAKVEALGKLAQFFFTYRAEKQADSVLQLQLQLAEVSNNKNLIYSALFGKALSNIETWARMETFDRALLFADKGLTYAREEGHKEYEAIARLRKAELLRKRGQYDNALQATALLFPLLNYIESDSLKAVWFLEVGSIFLAKGNAIDAYTHFNSAYDLAYSMKNHALLSQVYHQLAVLYTSMNDRQQARKNLLLSLDLNTQTGNKAGLLKDYYELARVTDIKAYIHALSRLADSIGSERYQLLSKRLMFGYMVVKEKNSQATLQYLYSNPDLHQSVLNSGKANYNFNIANIYHYGGQHDSAILYYAKAEPEMQQSFGGSIRSKIAKDIGECYLQLGNHQKAILYFEDAFALGQQANNLDSNAVLALKLGQLYAQAGQYQKALSYNQQYIYYKDTLEGLANDRSLVQLELEREENKHEKDLAELKKKELRKHNLQYMGISLGIVAFFTLLILMGMFKVSKLTVRVLGFFAFICLFEFVILLIDTYLHHATHAEPLKIWIAKIFIIALLLPLHHFLEHKVVQFLESQKLLKMRQRFSVQKFWARKKVEVVPEAPSVQAPVIN